ncbi:MAG TPA: non-ribosomal peptide synthetase, partial [Clostridium sp.]|nr:non-ribosomal peptide synthetase [Clostridium sp.]
PKERIEYIIEDSKMKVLLSKNDFMIGLSNNIEKMDINNEEIFREKNEKIDNINELKDLAYVIYTSGSTGRPKGVMVEHRNVIHVCNWYNNKYDVKVNKNTLQITNIAFDVAVLETIVVVVNGGTIYIPKKEDIFDKDKFKEYVNQHKIQSVQFVPETLRQLIAESDKMESLSLLISGGDVLESSLIKKVIDKGYNLYNHYGPTETTVDTITTLSGEENVIGRPVENSTVYIMNKNEKLQPIGVPGEICIGGDGVVRGYLNNEKLTNTKFIKDPFNSQGYLYKTGDLGRFALDGNVEFLGRIDNQVKIRGIRIELGEIENQLLKHELIQKAVVIDRKTENDEKYLCAYIIANSKMSTEEIRKFLSLKLPEYMIPNFTIQLSEFPLTINGKIDRNALPEPIINSEEVLNNEQPSNEIERKVSQIWSEILNIDNIGVNANFFELGGHSLKASIVISKINKEFNSNI